MTETELAAAVCKYLEDLQFEVFKEVQCEYGGPIVDIVARRGRLLWAVECKTQLNATVCAQAERHLRDANLVSIAVPTSRNRTNYVVKSWLERTAKDQGIGIIQVDRWEWQDPADRLIVEESARPKFRRKRSRMLEKTLHEGHKNYAEAGNAEGLRWSPFKATCDKVLSFVKRNPGCTVAELIEEIDHHYRSVTSAKQSIVKWARLGKVPGVRVEEGRPVRLYSTDASAGGSPETVHSRRDRESEV